MSKAGSITGDNAKATLLVWKKMGGRISTMWIIQRGIIRNPESSALALVEKKIGRRALVNPSWFSV